MSGKQSQFHAVIMAGGAGTRFWPASRKTRPKQLLPLGPQDEVMLTATVGRAERLVGAGNVWIVSSSALLDAVQGAAPTVPSQQLLGEPTGRNTAACVGWACAEIYLQHPEAVLAVLPADHLIGDEDRFRATLELALTQAQSGALVTVGITPTRPETGYGYIEMGESLGDGVFEAKAFVEKPDLAGAKAFLAKGTFLWNSGMFFFHVKSMLAEIRLQIPELGTVLDGFISSVEAGNPPSSARETLLAAYPQLPKISIDHGVMEHAASIQVVRGEFQWSDLGSWLAAWELSDKDGAENALPKQAVALDSSGCFVQADSEKLVALLGVSNLVVIDTPDAILVTTQDRAQDVRRVVELLQQSGRERWT